MNNNELEAYFQNLQEMDVIPDSLVIAYSDLHEYHGGIAYELRTNGLLLRIQIEQSSASETSSMSIKNSQIQKVLQLVCELQLWDQKEIVRPPNPDESKAHFQIAVNEKKMTTWEWYNDLHQNNRLIRLRNMFEELFLEEISNKE